MTTLRTKRYYQKMSGFATPSGPMYEIKLSALLFLRGVNNGGGFQLATNVAWAGALDDVVFRYQPQDNKGHWVTFFIQTKHTNRSRLSLEMLNSNTGDFALLKYFEAYQRIKETMSKTDRRELFNGDIKDCMYVLFTNLKANSDSEDVIVDMPGALAGFLPAESGKILNFNPDGGTDAEKGLMETLCKGVAKADTEVCGDSDVRAFLRNLFVFCDQPNEKDLRELIKKELEKIELTIKSGVNIDLLYDALVESFEGWYANENYILDKESDILDRARDRVLTDECYRQELSKVKMDVSFKDNAVIPLQNILKSNFSLLLIECCESSCRLTSNKLFQTIREPCLYSSVDTFRTRQSPMSLKWEASKVEFLVLSLQKFSRTTKLEIILETLKQVYEIAGQSGKRLVVLSGLENDLGLTKKLGVEFSDGFVQMQDQFEFSQIEESCQITLLAKTVIHQGCATTFSQLCDLKNSEIEFDALSVMEMMNNSEQISIGPDLTDGIAYYIPRFVEQATEVKVGILSDDLQENIAIFVSSIEDVKILLMKSDKNLSDELVDDIVLQCSMSYFVNDSENSLVTVGEQFVLGTKECNVVRLLHWENDRLPALRVYSQNNLLKGCILFLSSETNEEDVFTLSEFHSVKHFFRYNEPTLQWVTSRDGDMNVVRGHIDDTQVAVLDQNELSRLDEKLVLVSAEPGMGKTTLLANLAKHTKTIHPCFWTIVISLCDQTDLLAENLHADVVEFLTKASGITSPLQKVLFRYALEVTGNVIVLLDGYDEITPTYVKECCLLFTNVLKTKAKKIWITSRSIFQTHLEDHLSTLAVRIRKFDEADQKNFFKCFWNDARLVANSSTAPSEEKVNELIIKLIEVMSRDLKDNEKKMLGIPLQTRMMAEIYQDYVIGSVQDVPSVGKMDFLQLMEAFVIKKVSHSLGKKKVNSTDVNYKNQLKNTIKSSEKNHMVAALIAFFSTEKVRLFVSKKTNSMSMFFRAIKRGENKIGIIEAICENKPRFIHRVFIEYFVAKWFAKHFEDHTQFLEKYLYTPDFDIVRNIFDRFLARDCPLHIAVLNEDFGTTLKLIHEENIDVHSLDLGGRTALHLAAAYGISNIQKDNAEIRIFNALLSQSRQLTLVKDFVLESAPFRYADISHSWAIIQCLLPDKHGTRTVTTLLSNPEDQTRLESIFSHDLEQLMGLVLDSGLSVDYILEDTSQRIISRACYHGSYRVVKVLIDRNANVNRLNHEDESPLHIAAKRGNIDLLSIISESTACLNSRDKFGRTALHLAATYGQNDAVNDLLFLGADIRLQEYTYGSTALHHAAVSNDSAETVVSLLSKLEGAERDEFLHTHTFYGDTALHWAARNGCVSEVKVLVLYSGGQISEVNFDGETPLMQAAQNGHADVVTLLITRCRLDVKTYINMQDREGMTALLHSALYGHSEVVKILIQNGANVSLCDRDGETSLHYAVCVSHQNVVEVLLAAMNETERIAFANLADNFGKTAVNLASDDDTEIVNLLGPYSKGLPSILLPAVTCLDDEAKEMVEQRANFERVSLHVAVGCGLNDLVKNMIEAKNKAERVFFVKSFDRNGNTLLHWAAKNKNPEIVDLLINSGANVDCRNMNGETPLALAALEGNLEVVKIILNSFHQTVGREKKSLLRSTKSKYINSNDYLRWTALHNASNKGHADTVAHLVNLGGDIRASNIKDGNNPLHLAAQEGHSSVVEVLIKACPINDRADYINSSNKYGNTALLVAVEETCLESVVLLVKAGSNLSHKNHRGQTALMMAAECGNHDNVKYILESFEDPSRKAERNTDKNRERVLQLPQASDISTYLKMKDEDGLTALHLAASEGNKDVMASLIQHGANLRMRAGIYDCTPLHLASEEGHFDVVREILETIPKKELSTYINTVDGDNNTALHLASREGFLEIVTALIQSGCDVFLRNSEKETPLSLAALNGHLNVVTHLLDICNGMTPSTVNDTFNKSESLKNLSKIDYIENNTMHGKTALTNAVTNGHTNVVEYLINEGAPINNEEERFTTILQEAAKNGDSSTLKVLIEALAKSDYTKRITYSKDDYDVNAYGYFCQTALYLAAEIGSLECVVLLVTAGANVAVGDTYKQTPLMIAAANGHLEVLKHLIDSCGVGSNGSITRREYILMPDELSRTAITYAENESRDEVVALLKSMLVDL